MTCLFHRSTCSSAQGSEPCHGRIRESLPWIYFVTMKNLPGAELEFTVALPVELPRVPRVSIHAHSRVLRAEREEKTTHHVHRLLPLSKD